MEVFAIRFRLGLLCKAVSIVFARPDRQNLQPARSRKIQSIQPTFERFFIAPPLFA